MSDNMRKVGRLFTLTMAGLMIVALAACHNGSSKSDVRNIKPNIDVSEIGMSGIGSMPPLPRRTQRFSLSTARDSAIRISLSGTVEVVTFGAAFNLSALSLVKSELILMKNNPNGESLTTTVQVEDPAGSGRKINKIIPLISDGKPYVGFCAYSASLELAKRFDGSVKVLGSGASDSQSFSDLSRVVKSSSYWQVTPDDSFEAMSQICVESYKGMAQKQVQDDLKKFLLSKVSFDGATQTTLGKIITAALYGPADLERIRYNDHHWNIRRAAIQKDAGLVKVSGKIEHSTKGMLNDDVSYQCQGSDPEQISVDVDFKQRSMIDGYRDTARSLVREICHDAVLENL